MTRGQRIYVRDLGANDQGGEPEGQQHARPGVSARIGGSSACVVYQTTEAGVVCGPDTRTDVFRPRHGQREDLDPERRPGRNQCPQRPRVVVGNDCTKVAFLNSNKLVPEDRNGTRDLGAT
jgi:hypothetical protein